jgi:nucleotide-binding universal stress UspA family protein
VDQLYKMSFAFNTILIPVDFSVNTEVAVKKAIELADTNVNIHLVHVLNESGNSNIVRKTAGNEYVIPVIANSMLQQWKNSIGETLPSSMVYTWLLPPASVQEAIRIKAKEIDADLIVIGKRSSHNWFPFLNTVLPGALAETTNAAVLTVKPGSLYNKIRTVIVPVNEEIPEHKIDVIATLCKKQKIKVHLVTFLNDSGSRQTFSASQLLKAYQWLRNVLHCQVEYSVLQGYNKAKALLAYAEKIDADILLLNPKSETKIGWPNRHISDALPSESKVQVLMVQPD